MRTSVTTSLHNMLSIISVAEDYGYDDIILMESLSGILEYLTDDEIESYARSVGDMEGYGEGDYISVKEKLETFRRNYIDN